MRQEGGETMDMVQRRSTIVGIVTLIVGLVVGIGIGVWGIQTSSANSAPASTTQSTTTNNANSNATSNATDQNKDDVPLLIDKNWNPFLDFERMQEQIDRAIRDASEKFSFNNQGASMFRPDAGYSSSFDLRDRKD